MDWCTCALERVRRQKNSHNKTKWIIIPTSTIESSICLHVDQCHHTPLHYLPSQTSQTALLMRFPAAGTPAVWGGLPLGHSSSVEESNETGSETAHLWHLAVAPAATGPPFGHAGLLVMLSLFQHMPVSRKKREKGREGEIRCTISLSFNIPGSCQRRLWRYPPISSPLGPAVGYAFFSTPIGLLGSTAWTAFSPGLFSPLLFHPQWLLAHHTGTCVHMCVVVGGNWGENGKWGGKWVNFGRRRRKERSGGENQSKEI